LFVRPAAHPYIEHTVVITVAKANLKKIEASLAEIQSVIDDFREAVAAEKAAAGQDDGGQRIEPTDRPGGMDSAPSLDTRTGRKLTARGDSPAARSLSQIPGYSRLQR
jgi:hypothetical protein